MPTTKETADTVAHETADDIANLLTRMHVDNFAFEFTIRIVASKDQMAISSMKTGPVMFLDPSESAHDVDARRDRIMALNTKALPLTMLLSTLLHDMAADLATERAAEISAPVVD